MTIVDRGQGDPMVLVPGLQGRWEYLGPTVDALARSHRVITFSLCDKRPGSDPEVQFAALVHQVLDALDERQVHRATICGISLGGRVALRFAAQYPKRTRALILASVPGPAFHLKPSHRMYARFPWLFAPLFFAGMPRRLKAELESALPTGAERRAFLRGQFRTLLRAPVSPARMAARARLIDGMDTTADCRRITAPTLVMTGEEALDHVVPAGGTSEYGHLIANARTVVLERTGHLGCMTRPTAFADAIGKFLNDARTTDGEEAAVASRSNEHAA